MTSTQQRAELHRQIWQIANEVRGSVDGWDFKQYVLGTLFYRFISENFSSYIEAGDESVKYAALPDNVITDDIKDDAIKTKGYFIYPSQLFASIAAGAHRNENLNTDLAAIFKAIEGSANGYPSEPDIKGLFADFDTTSNRLGNTVTDKNTRLAAVLKGVAGLKLDQFSDNQIDLFGDRNTKNVVLEKSYKEYLEGFTDIATGKARRGYLEVVKELQQRFPNPDEIVKESDKKDFAKLFGEYLRVENILQNYDEFASLKALQDLDVSDAEAVETFKEEHYLNDDDLDAMQTIKVPAERTVQDYRSTYNDIRDWLRREKAADQQDESSMDWDEVVFEIDLLKSQEINLDYILELIFEHNKNTKDKSALVEEVRRLIRASLGNRAKESLVVDFINQTNLDTIPDKSSIIDAFFSYAQVEQQREVKDMIAAENLNEDAAKRYIAASLKREYASENGTELNAILPKLSLLNPQYLTKKQSVLQKIAAFVEKFKGVGGRV